MGAVERTRRYIPLLVNAVALLERKTVWPSLSCLDNAGRDFKRKGAAVFGAKICRGGKWCRWMKVGFEWR